MPNMFISLDVPRGEGVGLPAIVSNTGHPKTFVLGGAVLGGRYIVEGSNDGGNIRSLSPRRTHCHTITGATRIGY